MKDARRVHAFDADAIGSACQSVGLPCFGRRAGDGGCERQHDLEPRREFQVGEAGREILGQDIRLVFQNGGLDHDFGLRPQEVISRGG